MAHVSAFFNFAEIVAESSGLQFFIVSVCVFPLKVIFTFLSFLIALPSLNHFGFSSAFDTSHLNMAVSSSVIVVSSSGFKNIVAASENG